MADLIQIAKEAAAKVTDLATDLATDLTQNANKASENINASISTLKRDTELLSARKNVRSHIRHKIVDLNGIKDLTKLEDVRKLSDSMIEELKILEKNIGIMTPQGITDLCKLKIIENPVETEFDSQLKKQINNGLEKKHASNLHKIMHEVYVKALESFSVFVEEE